MTPSQSTKASLSITKTAAKWLNWKIAPVVVVVGMILLVLMASYLIWLAI
jgi:hypothetical protein